VIETSFRLKFALMPATRQLELTHQPVDYFALVENMRTHRAGAVVLFLGTVRELTAGKQTASLDYEAYPEMAIRQLNTLIDDAETRWPLLKVGVIHRLGHLELGDIAVAVAVSCPHRREAFESGQWIMDRIKEVVPIWKKENWADGSTEWVHPEATT
jgi:molybdopterin synthase catalytic subunit